MPNRDRILILLLLWFRSTQVFVCALTHLDRTHSSSVHSRLCSLTLTPSTSIISNFWDGQQQLITRKREETRDDREKQERGGDRETKGDEQVEREEGREGGRKRRREGREGRRKERREGGKAQGWASDPWQHTQ